MQEITLSSSENRGDMSRRQRQISEQMWMSSTMSSARTFSMDPKDCYHHLLTVQPLTAPFAMYKPQGGRFVTRTDAIVSELSTMTDVSSWQRHSTSLPFLWSPFCFATCCFFANRPTQTPHLRWRLQFVIEVGLQLVFNNVKAERATHRHLCGLAKINTCSPHLVQHGRRGNGNHASKGELANDCKAGLDEISLDELRLE